MKSNKSIYEECPVYQTEDFMLRLVEAEDADDLLECYSDMKAAELFNSDNCTSDFVYKSKNEMIDCIRFWIDEYNRGYYVRFGVLSRKESKVIGTIEMFSKKQDYGDAGVVGVLRLDLASWHENTKTLGSIMDMIEDHFYRDFEVDSIITKAVPQATARIDVLKKKGYSELEQGLVVQYPHYFLKQNK